MDRDPTAFADIHNHLVPDVDDGARHLEDTLDAVERMTLMGIRKIITTPHIDGRLTLEPEALEERLQEVNEAFEVAAAAVAAAFPEVDFRRGHEVMMDIPDVDFSDPRMRLAGTHFVLVEWPRLHLPPGTAKVLRRIRDQGYVPVVAHPERYVGMDLETAGSWRDAGALLQVNYGALEGRYGGESRKMALRLLRRGWADYLASDFHARPDRSIYKKEAGDRLAEAGAGEAFVILSLTNPARVLRDEMPIPVPPLPPESGLWARVRALLDVESR
jgi:protein-tyrosine phosphatase